MPELTKMSDLKRLAPMQRDLAERLISAITANLGDLTEAMKKERLSTIAWLARNPLELSLWSACRM
jgi:hypothetical protein